MEMRLSVRCPSAGGAPETLLENYACFSSLSKVWHREEEPVQFKPHKKETTFLWFIFHSKCLFNAPCLHNQLHFHYVFFFPQKKPVFQIALSFCVFLFVFSFVILVNSVVLFRF